jgi:hypothetical protein
VRIVFAVTRVVIVIIEIGIDFDCYETGLKLMGDSLVSVTANPDSFGHEAHLLHLRGMEEGYDVVLDGHDRLPSWMRTPVRSCWITGML